MGSPEYEHGPSPNRPLNAPGDRPTLRPVLMVIAILAVVGVVFLLLFVAG